MSKTGDVRRCVRSTELCKYCCCVLLVLCSGCTGMAGSDSQSQVTCAVMPITAQEVLFDGGKERMSPVADLVDRLSTASPEQRRRIVSELSAVIRGSDGFARAVAGKALIRFFEYGNTAYMTQEAVDAMARYCVELSTMEVSHVTGSDGLEDWIIKPVYIRFEVLVEGFLLPLDYCALPSGWQARDVEVYVDGNRVLSSPEPTSIAVELLSLRSVLPEERRMGRHIIKTKATMVHESGFSSAIEAEGWLYACKDTPEPHGDP